jgi:hypothetical protein
MREKTSKIVLYSVKKKLMPKKLSIFFFPIKNILDMISFATSIIVGINNVNIFNNHR